MAQLIPGDASLIITRLLILTVWGVTPFSWLVLITRAVRYYLHHYTTHSIDRTVWNFVVKHSPRTVSQFWAHLLSPRWRWASNFFYFYCALEAAFSLYHLHLSRRIQRPGPRPLYGRRFLRSVFAQALQAGLNTASEDTSELKQSFASAVSPSHPGAEKGTTELISRGSNGQSASSTSGLNETSSPSDVRQRLGRLRAASFVPQFVSQPISGDDPRAIKFQEDQAKWFFGVPFEQITRREVMHWLAWSLFATDLEVLEAERDGLVTLTGGESAGVQPGPAAKLSSNGLDSATPSTFNSPMPPSASTFGGLPPSFSTGASIEEQEDVRKVRARDGEWDPTTGDRLKFLEYCMELLETRQGRSYPEDPPATQSRSQAGSGSQESTYPTLLKTAQDKVAAKGPPRIRMMRLTIDPVRTRSRPLLCYLATNTLSHLTIRRAVRGGFQLCHEGRLPYLYRPAPDASSTTDSGKRLDRTPLLVLHGLGIGLAQYASLVSFFLHSPIFAHRPIVILIQPNISQSILSPSFLKPFGHHETTSAFRSILAKNSWTSIDVLSHSYGSLVHSWLIKSIASSIRRSCFVDPVCFQLWVPFVCSNFVYKRARTPIEMLMRYFVARELGTANTLCRYFDWSSNILWPNEIEKLQDGRRTRFYLAEEDAILSAKDTLEYLVESGCPRENIHYGKGKAHGEMLMHGGEDFERIVGWLSMEI